MKSTCTRGHALTADNVYISIEKGRERVICRACSLARSKARYQPRPRRPLRPAVERFKRYCIADDETGCWNWQRGISTSGYGTFYAAGRGYAHRWSYEHFVGPIPEGLTIDHLCRNRRCVNPAHMEPVTLAENTRRELAHRERATHCKYGHPFDRLDRNGAQRCSTCSSVSTRRRRAHLRRQTTLTPDDIRRIRARRAAGETYASIGADYQLAATTICGIVKRRAWKHVD